MFTDAFHITLDHGVTDTAGTRHMTGHLRVPDGRAEEAIAGLAARQVSSQDETSVLLACLTAVGGYAPVTADLVNALTQSDRDRLMLAIRETLMGPRIQLTTKCENPDCGTEVDLNITHADLLPNDDAPRGGFDDGPIALRPIAGDDNPDADDIWPALAPGTDWDQVDHATRQHAALTLSRADPGVVRDIGLTCPTCHLPITLHLNPVSLLARELALGAPRLLAEVHTLAFHYGWREDDVLALPRHRRWQYLSMITAQLTGGALTMDWS